MGIAINISVTMVTLAIDYIDVNDINILVPHSLLPMVRFRTRTLRCMIVVHKDRTSTPDFIVVQIFNFLFGLQEEAPNQIIQVDQSQADRSKRKFDPVSLQPNAEHSWKVTIGRLHFSDTTLNNMRKRGKPNPDQRYFLLVVGIFAHSQGKEYPIVQQCSEKLIVRVSEVPESDLLCFYTWYYCADIPEDVGACTLVDCYHFANSLVTQV